jgi:hypothetical protein
MPASKAEQVFEVLKTLLETVPGAAIDRNSVLPEKIPPGGLIILRDGDPGEPEQALGGFGNEAFPDCAVGALPPAGAAYGLEVLLDESLAGQPEVYFEAGDHTRLIGLSGAGFRKLLADARHGRFNHHV